MKNSYSIPVETRMGHVHLKVADLNRALSFYRDLLGFESTQYYGENAVFLSAGGYHHHIGLNTWNSKDAPPAPRHHAGLYHLAILYPTRKDLANILKRLMQEKTPIDGASDHGVSEAIYLRDPDDNDVELYWDKPKKEWPVDSKGNLQMTTQPLDIKELLQLAD